MNLSLALKIVNLCEISRNYNLPHVVHNNISTLFDLACEWLSLYYVDTETKYVVSARLEKSFSDLANTISQVSPEHNLIRNYDNIMIDQMTKSFEKIMLRYNTVDLAHDLSALTCNEK